MDARIKIVIKEPEATEWLRAFRRRPSHRISICRSPPAEVGQPEEFVSPGKFMRETGISRNLLRRFIRDGMPAAENGWPHRALAMAWIDKIAKSPQTAIGNGPGRFESVLRFSKRVGGSTAVVYRMVKDGMPAGRNGWIEIDAALNWIHRHPERTPLAIARHLYAPKRVAGTVEFSKILRCSYGFIVMLIRDGMPGGGVGNGVARRGTVAWVYTDEALAWISRRNSYNLPPIGPLGPIPGYERHIKFALRVRISIDQLITLKKRPGFPAHENGWIHIYRGLCWVRDNTKIKIPASAWDGAVPDDAPDTSKIAAD